MLVKEIRRNGLTAWCPSTEHRDLLAVGTLASSIDSGFSAGGTLEIYKLTYDNSTSMPAVASTNLEDRFHKLAWGSLDTSSYGVIAGGMSDGSINFYDPSALLSSKPPLLWSAKEHSGPVQALDFRINKPYLLASGGPNAEILIWALTSESPTAMIPGSPNSQLTGSISVVQWNPQVSHILGTTTFDGVSAVWDLRTKRSVVTFFDPARKYRCRAMAWNPDVATSIVTGSEDDSNPVISIWDLRNTYAPAKELRGHEKGIWSLSWCPNDQNLLVSSSKDNRTICWNTATGKELCEVEKGEMWNLESSWSPRLQSLVSTSSLEGKIRVYSLQDPGPRLTAKGGVGSGVSDEISRAFESPPKWFKRPCGAVFGFGGQLMSWNTKGNKIAVQRLVTDKEFVQRAERLEETIENGRFKEFCEEKKSKAEKANNQNEKDMWGCIKVLFENARTPLLELLHFDPATCDKEIADFIRELQKKVKEEPAVVIIEKEEKEISEEKKQEENNLETTEEKIEEENVEKVEKEKEKVEEEEEKSSSSDAFDELMGGSNDGDDPFADLIGGSSTTNENEDDPFASIAAASPLPDRFNSQSPGLTQNPSSPLISLPASFSKDIILPFDATDQEDSILTKAIIVGKFASAVDCCIASNLWADALVLSACGGTELWSQTQKRYLESQLKKKNSKNYLKLIDMIFKRELELAVDSIHLKHWNSILGILCTYAKPEEFPELCDRLGHRLLKNTPKQTDNNEWAAILCFICSGNLEKIIFILEKREESLVDLIEKIVVLKCSFNDSNNANKSFNENAQEYVGRNYEKYAALLASQGKMREALRYLEMVKEEKSYKRDQILFDRVYNAMIAQEGDAFVSSSSSSTPGSSTSTSAFDVVDVAEREKEFAVNTNTSQAFKDESSRKVVDVVFESSPDTNNLFGRAPSQEIVTPPQQPSSVQVNAPQSAPYGASSGLSHSPSQPYGQPSQPYGQPSQPSFQPADGGYSHPSQPSHPSLPSQPSSSGYTGGNTTGYAGGNTTTGYSGGNTGGYSYQGGGFSSAPTLPSAGQPSNIPSSNYDTAPQPSYGYGPPTSSGNASNPPAAGLEPKPAAPAPAPAPVVQINQTGQTIIQAFNAISQSIDPAVPSLPAMLQKQWTEAKERLNLLFAKLNSGGFGDEADAVVLQFATAIHSNDIAQANQLHKTLASKYWNQIESKIMIGLKRFITVKEFLLKRK